MVDEYAAFTLDSVRHGKGFRKEDLREIARRLKEAMTVRNFEIGELIGSSTDIWGFVVDVDDLEFLVSVSPEYRAAEDRWSAQILLDDVGWMKNTREFRLAEMKRIEWAVHDALLVDLKARDIEWQLGKGRAANRKRQPTP